MVSITKLAVPVFVIVNTSAADDCPITTLPKSFDIGLILNPGTPSGVINTGLIIGDSYSMLL